MLARVTKQILVFFQNIDRPDPAPLSYEAFGARNDPCATLDLACANERRKMDPSYSNYSQANSTTCRLSSGHRRGRQKSRARRGERRLADEGSAAVRTARELRISQAHQIWQNTGDHLERLTNAQSTVHFSYAVFIK